MGNSFGGNEDGFEQPVDVALFGKRRANVVELFETMKKIAVARIHGLMPKAQCFMVLPLQP
jgi:hypothetical protein